MAEHSGLLIAGPELLARSRTAMPHEPVRDGAAEQETEDENASRRLLTHLNLGLIGWQTLERKGR